MRSANTLLCGVFTFAFVVAGMIMASPRAAALQDEFVTLTNQERITKNLQPLKVSNELTRSAHAKAQHMLENNYWGHDAPDGTSPWTFIRGAGYEYSYAGENLAKGFQTEKGVMKALMDSPAHKENILKPDYTHIGIAEVEGTLLGEKTTVIVLHYGVLKQSEPEVQPLPSEDLMQQLINTIGRQLRYFQVIGDLEWI